MRASNSGSKHFPSPCTPHAFSLAAHTALPISRVRSTLHRYDTAGNGVGTSVCFSVSISRTACSPVSHISCLRNSSSSRMGFLFCKRTGKRKVQRLHVLIEMFEVIQKTSFTTMRMGCILETKHVALSCSTHSLSLRRFLCARHVCRKAVDFAR